MRVKERKQWAREFAEIPLMTSDSGAVVKLGDIASVRDGFEESGFHSQFNATPSVEIEIYRVGKQSPLEISEAVLEVMEEFEAQLPEGVNWRVDGNAAEEYDDRLSLLLENAGLAIVIVLLILSLFLEIRLAFWVMMGMTISFVGAIVFLPMVGVSINMVSMFGFLVVLGIVVDDAIVVGENVYEHQQQGGDRLTASITGGWRKDIEVDLSHNDIDVLETVAKRFVEDVERYEATRVVTDNYNRGKVQFDLKLRPEARGLGLTADDVGQQVRDAFFRALATRQLRGTNEFEVRVKLPESERKDLYFFDEFVVQTPDGIEVPLYEVVDVSRVEAFSSISRRGGRRVVTVSNNVRPKSAIGRVIESLNAEDLPALRADYPGLTWSFEGSQAEMRESTDSLWGGFLLAMAVIFSLLAVAFRSYVQPLIVLSAIPFGIIGAVIGHILLGHDLSLMSVMGIIALSGVVVNDSLIMIDLANRERKSMSAFDAIHKAGSRRFRPIMLTTLTTFGGLSPIIFETSNQANHLIPMAISLGFGIVFATGLILVLVPCFYLIVDDLTILGRRVFK